jgi:uncharacterized protein (DUF305 family)
MPQLLQLLAVPAVGALLLATGCSGSQAGAVAASPAPTVTYTAEVPVLVPGRPGEPSATIAPGETGELPNLATYNDADVDFVRDMVVHHAQALRMAELAPGRVSDPRTAALAERIAAAQGPEIAGMQAWLESKDLQRVDLDHASHAPGGTAHADMPGMATAAQLEQLVAARGEAFDRLFLQLMTVHHEGALQMADLALADGENVQVRALAQDIRVGQAVEIDRLQHVLRDL